MSKLPRCASLLPSSFARLTAAGQGCPPPCRARVLRGALGGATLALSLVLTGCQHVHAEVEEVDAPAVLRVASPERADAAYEREYVGRVRAIRYVEVRPRVKGVIESVAVDEGSSVQAEQVLFSIRANELEQKMLEARAATTVADAELKLARLERDNTRLLFEKSVVSNAELVLAESKVEALAAKLEQSKAEQSQVKINLEYAKVRAPFEGIVNRIAHRVGSLVSEESLLTTIADTREVFVYFRMSELEYLEHMASKPEERPKQVYLKLANGTLHPEAGVLDTVENEIDQETGNIAFRARFPNPSGTLKHGSSGKIVIRKEIPRAVMVPQKSTFDIQGRLFVYVVDTEGKARAREIIPQVRLEDSFVVAEGLDPEDRLVLEGIQKLEEGARVQAVPAT